MSKVAYTSIKRGSWPALTVIVEAVYNPNPVVFFNRMEEKSRIRRFGNNFSIQGSYTTLCTTTTPMVFTHQSPGEGQKPTLTLASHGIVGLMFVIPDRRAQMFRKYCGAIVIRCLGHGETPGDGIFTQRVDRTK
jgi:hypothetical protein